jgi:hypothetical protein
MSHLEDTANRLLTDSRPTAPDGSSDSPKQPEAATQPGPENSVPTAATPVPAAGPTASQLGIPDTLPETWCPNCKTNVMPKGKGSCPRCGRVLKGAFLSRRHPVNLLRKQQILQTLAADYKPRTAHQRSMCEHLAGCHEQLEVLKPTTQEYARLAKLSLELAAALEATRRENVAADRAADDGIHARLAALSTLSLGEVVERLTGLLQSAIKLQDAKTAAANQVSGAGTPVMPGAPSIQDAQATLSPAPLRQAPNDCPYCGGSCIGPEHPSYGVLHWRDPLEVKRRADEATDVMYHQLGWHRRDPGRLTWD